MAIKFSCSSCGKKFSTKDEHAGRQSKCPACGWGIVIPFPVAREVDESPPPMPPVAREAPAAGVPGARRHGRRNAAIAAASLLAPIALVAAIAGIYARRPGGPPAPAPRAAAVLSAAPAPVRPAPPADPEVIWSPRTPRPLGSDWREGVTDYYVIVGKLDNRGARNPGFAELTIIVAVPGRVGRAVVEHIAREIALEEGSELARELLVVVRTADEGVFARALCRRRELIDLYGSPEVILADEPPRPKVKARDIRAVEQEARLREREAQQWGGETPADRFARAAEAILRRGGPR
jgi:DNA-directed RNA polymerase subunit RPC12/RpoP